MARRTQACVRLNRIDRGFSIATKSDPQKKIMFRPKVGRIAFEVLLENFHAMLKKTFGLLTMA